MFSRGFPKGSPTLIRFGKFGEITVLMEEIVILTQTQMISRNFARGLKFL